MSNHSHDHEDDHTGPIKTPKQLLLAVLFSFLLSIFIIIALVYYVVSGSHQTPGEVDADKALASRLQKVGVVEIRDADRELKTGEEVFKAQCATCHATGMAGAPKFGDKAAWAARIRNSYETLLNSALHGKGAMAPQGGGDFDDIEIGRAVVYMANAAGGKFAEPQKSGAAAPAASAPATSK